MCKHSSCCCIWTTAMNIVNVGYRSTNYYVLVSLTTRLLVDAGWPATLPQLRHQLKRKRLVLHDIRYLLCTHYHPDHAGLAQELIQEGIQLIVVDEQRAAVPQHIPLNTAVKLSTSVSRSFLRGCGIDGKIIWTPGHSDDSVSLVLDSGIAFTGDLQPPLGSDEPPYRIIAQSWRGLQAHGVKHVYPGHGPIHILQDSTS